MGLNYVAFSMDEYIWLDGRPVAFMRSKFNSTLSTRQADPSTDVACPARVGYPAGLCGLHFVVTDHIGKPVALLDRQLRLEGAAEYEPFGNPGRQAVPAGETAHPYGISNQLLATCDPQTGRYALTRVLMHYVDTVQTNDYVVIKNSCNRSPLALAAGAS